MTFAPSVFVFLLLRKKLLTTVGKWYFLLGAFIFIAFVGSFYGLRELKGHGYLQAVYEQELGGRFNTVIEGHSGPWSYYWDYLKEDGFGNWYWALPVSLALFWFYPNGKLSRATGFCLLTSIGMLIIISFAQTKLKWYVLPSIPLMAIVIGTLIDQMSLAIFSFIGGRKEVPAIILIAIFSFQPVAEAYDYVNRTGYDLNGDNFYATSYYFRDAIEGRRDLRHCIYLNGDYDLAWRLYVYRLNEIGVKMPAIEYWKNPQLHAGDKIIARFSMSKNYVEDHYQYTLIEDFYGVRRYLITGVK